jgi:hypothetical protein
VKVLETEFTYNADKRGDTKFVQVKRNKFAAIYQRFNMDGKPLEFEVFAIKTAGDCEVFGRFYEKYEQYPGASAFGRTAWSVGNEVAANKIFDEITRGEGSRIDGITYTDQPKQQVKVKHVGRGRPKANRPEVVFSKGEFCLNDLLKENSAGWTKPTLYLELMKFTKGGKVKETRRASMGRGRPVVYYKKI